MILIKLPWLPSAKKGFTTYAITISPFVLIRSDKADDLALLAHEQCHLDQVKREGWLKFYWSYLFNLDFRRQAEAEGYAIQKQVEDKL